ncbi:MAG TPA: NAD(+)/NADH kinase [Candidatus Latescibacteria bacterium]|nr:NAD(+)/NADH kinase [Candidatus Latescibacterota bacterium]
MIKEVGIIANVRKAGVAKVIKDLIGWLDRKGIAVLLDNGLSSLCRESGRKPDNLFPSEELVRRSDLIVALGGDGTILSAARIAGPYATPVLGVNLGSLGFLAQIGPDQLEQGLERTLAGDYRIERRMILKASKGDETFFALNEILIERGASPRLIRIEVNTEEGLINRYMADGLIVSTPTGSTGHSLSAGGPIVHPGMDAIILTPVCPHSLSLRPLILPADTALEVEVESDRPPVMLIADGQKGCDLESGERVAIKKAPHTANLIDLHGKPFYDVLRVRLRWGGSYKG